MKRFLQPTRQKLLLTLAFVIILEMYILTSVGNNAPYVGNAIARFKVWLMVLTLMPLTIICYLVFCVVFYSRTR